MRDIKLNREIKFRGQQINTKQWVYGYLYRNKGLYVICENIRYAEEEPILIDTIGQYTGLKDKNGKEIYEGDIISNGYEKCIVVWVKEYAGFMLKLINKEYENKEWTNPMIDLRNDEEVIGNIYENPELLKGETDENRN